MFSSTLALVQCQSEVRPEATLAALERGRAAGMTTIFNPAPAQADLPDRYCHRFSLPGRDC